MIGPPKCAVADSYLFEKIPRPTPLRFRLDDHRLAFLSDEHFRAFEPISLRQSDRLRPTSDKEFGCVHVDTVPMPVTVQVVPRSTNKEQCPLITTCEESRWNFSCQPVRFDCPITAKSCAAIVVRQAERLCRLGRAAAARSTGLRPIHFIHFIEAAMTNRVPNLLEGIDNHYGIVMFGKPNFRPGILHSLCAF